jgi:E2F transcription factor CC-MB domain
VVVVVIVVAFCVCFALVIFLAHIAMPISRSTPNSEEGEQLAAEVSDLQGEIRDLDECLEGVQGSLQRLASDFASSSDAFLTQEDIRSIPAYEGEQLLFVKAPAGTRLEVPDPDEVGVSERERECVCVCVYVRMCVGMTERVCVCVHERERVCVCLSMLREYLLDAVDILLWMVRLWHVLTT